MTQVTSAAEIAYLRSIIASPSSDAKEVAAAKGILAGLDQIPPGPQQQQEQDAYLAQVLKIAPGSDLAPGQIDEAINTALINYGNVISMLSNATSGALALSSDAIFALLAQAAIHLVNGELRNAQSQRDAAYELARASAQQQATDLRSEADSIESSARDSLIYTSVSAGIQIAGAAASMYESAQAYGASGDHALNIKLNAYAGDYLAFGKGGGELMSGIGGFFDGQAKATQKRLEADSADAAARADSEKQLASHMDSLIDQLQKFGSSMIQYTEGVAQAHNDALKAATRIA
jgi:hypothetical protein